MTASSAAARLTLVLSAASLCIACADVETSPGVSETPLGRKEAQTAERIAVYGTRSVSDVQFARVLADVGAVLDALDPGIRAGLLESGPKMIVARDEEELVAEIHFYEPLFPLEAVFVDLEGVDETLPGANGVSTTKLELMYLIVYYSLLTDPGLEETYGELRSAYAEATAAGLFSPGEAYQDGFVDEIHLHASENGALKFGSYLFALYDLYFGTGEQASDELAISTRADLETLNPKGFAFVETHLDN